MIFADDFQILQILGNGFFGDVVVCRERKSERLCAVNIFFFNTDSRSFEIDFHPRLVPQKEASKDEVARILTESRLLRERYHLFLVSSKYTFQTADRLCFVMEYVNGGELLFHLSRVSFRSDVFNRLYVSVVPVRNGNSNPPIIFFRRGSSARRRHVSTGQRLF